MARKRYKPEEIVRLLRQAEILHGQGLSMADATRRLGISEVTFYRWCKEYTGMNGGQLRHLKDLGSASRCWLAGQRQEGRASVAARGADGSRQATETR